MLDNPTKLFKENELVRNSWQLFIRWLKNKFLTILKYFSNNLFREIPQSLS